MAAFTRTQAHTHTLHTNCLKSLLRNATISRSSGSELKCEAHAGCVMHVNAGGHRETWWGASVGVWNRSKVCTAIMWKISKERPDPDPAGRVTEMSPLLYCQESDFPFPLAAPSLMPFLHLSVMPFLCVCIYYALLTSVWWIWAISGFGSGQWAA